ncbi:MAG: hypothetical protein LC775_13495, partial [Acidobacteria bacterium]|nr:hypothetical protein [Acidobacteriota bacterium]
MASTRYSYCASAVAAVCVRVAAGLGAPEFVEGVCACPKLVTPRQSSNNKTRAYIKNLLRRLL